MHSSHSSSKYPAQGPPRVSQTPRGKPFLVALFKIVMTVHAYSRGGQRYRGSADPENLIHDFCACGDHRPQLPAVHDLGRPAGGVSDQVGDLLDADPAMAHQTHERGP